MLRTLGQYAGRAKGIAREFQRSMDDAARQADIEELREVKKGLDDMRDAQHKMQRDMSQSFLDSPAKPAQKSDGEKPAAKKAGDGAAEADATPEPVKKSAAKSAGRSAGKSAKKVSEPRAEPGSVSGA